MSGDKEMEISMVWGGETFCRKRIQWTEEREKELLRLSGLAKSNEIGYINRLLHLWNQRHPELTTTSTALSQRLYVLRNRIVDDEPMPNQVEMASAGKVR